MFVKRERGEEVRVTFADRTIHACRDGSQNGFSRKGKQWRAEIMRHELVTGEWIQGVVCTAALIGPSPDLSGTVHVRSTTNVCANAV
jgi:hypothetical protein